VSDPVRLLLARHGQTEWHSDNRYVSRTDIGLTEMGREQASTLARRAEQEGVDLVLSSPLGRALETAKPAAAACNLEPQTDERLRELDFGGWEGRTLSEIRDKDPESVRRFEESAEHGFPGGEPLQEGVDRVLGVFAELSRLYPGRTVLVVAHNTLIRLALCRMLGVELGQYRRLMPRVVNGAVSEVRFSEKGGALYSFNDMGGFG
jgi:broad specificity phosphatase PhoE